MPRYTQAGYATIQCRTCGRKQHMTKHGFDALPKHSQRLYRHRYKMRLCKRHFDELMDTLLKELLTKGKSDKHEEQLRAAYSKREWQG